jgi:hypothetical protein
MRTTRDSAARITVAVTSPETWAGDFGRKRFVYRPDLNGGALTPTPHAFPNVASDPQYSRITRNDKFNFADLTPALPAVDREYLYGSLDRKICDQYLELFADFKYVRTFWDGALAPLHLSLMYGRTQAHPSGSLSGLASAYRFRTHSIHSPWRITPRLEDLIRGSRKLKSSAAPPGTQFTTGVKYRALEAGLRTDKITTNNYEFTGGLKGNLGEFGDYFKTWNWETGFRYSEDSRVERDGGIVNTNALRQALLDTNPATAFNPFGLNQNSRAVIDKVFTTTLHLGADVVDARRLEVIGDLFNLPAGPDLVRGWR